MSVGPPLCTNATTYIFPGIYSEQVDISANNNSGFMVFMKLSNEMPIMNGQDNTNYAFNITNAGRIIIRDLVIRDYNAYGILFDNSSPNDIMHNDIFSSGNGIYIGNGSEDIST